MSFLAAVIPDKAGWRFAADGLQGCPALTQLPPEARTVPGSPNGEISLFGRFIAVVSRASKGSFKPLLAFHSATAKYRDDEINWRSGHDRLALGELTSTENVYRNGLGHHRKLPWQAECPQGAGPHSCR